MIVANTKEDFLGRLNQAKQQYRRRDQLMLLCNEMYAMKKAYKSNYLGSEAVRWRNKAASEYWQSDNRPHNVVDVLTAVLSGNAPQWKVTINGSQVETLPSRAEKFLAGVFELNSMRQQSDLFAEIAFRTILDGGTGVRIYWDTEGGPPSNIDVVENPDQPEGGEAGKRRSVVSYDFQNFPIVLEVVPLSNLFPAGRGRMGRPFDEIYHCEQKTPNEVLEEWTDIEGANLKTIKEFNASDRSFTQYEYVEWWGQEKSGQVWYACMFNNKFIIAPKQINYPTIPYVITTFKSFDRSQPDLERLPFLYPLLWATQKKEYLTSRNFRLADMYGNMPIIYRGDNPVHLEGTWGDALNLGPEDTIEFPRWPGIVPDIYKLIEQAETAQSEGTFSSAMFGQVSTRMSGYALSQLVGADTLRTDTPRRNLELALTLIAKIIFGLMQEFSPDLAMGVNVVIKNKELAAMLSGEETKQLTVSVAVKPKHVADEIRLAALGIQMASAPNSPVSLAYILERFFGLEQPEDELNRKLSEEALQDPIVKLIALHTTLSNAGHFAASLVEEKLKQAMDKAASPEGALPQPEQAAGLGMGLPQTLGGNPPIIPAGGNVVEETGPEGLMELMSGGPVE